MDQKNKNKIHKELLGFVKSKGYSITNEVETEAGQLSQVLESQDLSDITEVVKWLEEKRRNYSVKVDEVGIKDLDHWQAHSDTGNIGHKSGKFFNIIGIRVQGAKGREVLSWTQPIIKQNECGILGILQKRINGVMHYLLYAKSEPGSVINPQLSPTLQATASNLGRAHGGAKPLFAEYFEEGGRGKVVVSVEQVEDPSRFYLKTNRCMIVEVPEDEPIEAPEDFIWLTLPQIKKLLKIDNAINALARAVFGSI
ncbi:MAG: NDP-hexose 2,3-dehydratase family protein [Patescibacteria group bacterium]|nr:NDP-hexose 2,3-dehydratase family protein [Patescibacteria group bacterium]MDE2218367.1 NDP-hexose 2,3-dehydratase family protein [Patescibacteria group bacterium]